MDAESRSQHLEQAQVPLDATQILDEQRRNSMPYGNIHTSRPTSARLMSWLILVVVIAIHSPCCSIEFVQSAGYCCCPAHFWSKPHLSSSCTPLRFSALQLGVLVTGVQLLSERSVTDAKTWWTRSLVIHRYANTLALTKCNPSTTTSMFPNPFRR